MPYRVWVFPCVRVLHIRHSLDPFGAFTDLYQLKVELRPEVPHEIADCEAWCWPHRRHARAIPAQDYQEPEITSVKGMKAQEMTELHDKAIEVVLLYDKPFTLRCSADGSIYTYSVQIEKSPVTVWLLDRLEGCRQFDVVTGVLEMLQLESELQKIAGAGLRRKNCM